MKPLVQKLNGFLCFTSFYNQVWFNSFQKKIKSTCITNVKCKCFFRQITAYCKYLTLSPIKFPEIKMFFQPFCKRFTCVSYRNLVRFLFTYITFAIYDSSKITFLLYCQFGNLKFIFRKRHSGFCDFRATNRTIFSSTISDIIRDGEKMLFTIFANSFNLGARTTNCFGFMFLHNHNVKENN